MRRLIVTCVCVLALGGTVEQAFSQFGGLRRRAEGAIDRATGAVLDKTTDKIICAATDKACQDKAKAEGKQVEIQAAPTPNAGAANPAPSATNVTPATSAGRVGDAHPVLPARLAASAGTRVDRGDLLPAAGRGVRVALGLLVELRIAAVAGV